MKWIIITASALCVISLVLALSLTLGRRSEEYLLVETNVGTIRGLPAEDGDYSMFMGIPYALVNESNPFGLSTPHPNFEGVFDAFDDTATCPQSDEFNNTIIMGTLDCLHLNIYVPNSASPLNKLPVLVWVHGGGFTIGSGGRYVHGPKFLVQHDVILVTINYRLGPYGFMCLDIPEVPGNQGLKDQLLALKWIHDNISAFNGDETKITLMGESAGAMSIEFLILSNRERLYNQVILQSGSALIPNIVHPSDNTLPLKIAAHLNFTTDDLHEAIEFLAGTDTDLVIAATIDLNLNFVRVCIESNANEESVITTHPEHLMPNVQDIRVLSGFNSHELMLAFITLPSELFEGLNVFYNQLSSIFKTDDNFEEMLNLTSRFYIGDEEVSHELKWDLIDFSSDIVFNYPTQRSIMRFLENDAVVYQYMFSYSGDRNFVKVRANITADGAAHADELGYLFDMAMLSEETNAQDQLIVDRMTTMWTNFVKYGDPTPEINDLLPVKWHQATKEKVNYINIDTDMTTGTRPYHKRLAFWDLFYITNYDKLIVH